MSRSITRPDLPSEDVPRPVPPIHGVAVVGLEGEGGDMVVDIAIAFADTMPPLPGGGEVGARMVAAEVRREGGVAAVTGVVGVALLLAGRSSSVGEPRSTVRYIIRRWQW